MNATDEILACYSRAAAMRAQGLSYTAIGRELCVGRDRAKKLCGPAPAHLVPVVVTRHRPLVQLLVERGIIPACGPGTRCPACMDNGVHGRIRSDSRWLYCELTTARVIAHATADDLRDADVIGVLPLHLAALARTATEIPLALTPEDRAAMSSGDLSIDRLRTIAGQPVTYKVTILTPRNPARGN